MMVAESSSLKDVYATFVRVITELESSLMFPTMLKDVPVQETPGMKLLVNTMGDCKDLHLALMSVKNEVLFGLKKDWYGGMATDTTQLNIAIKFKGILQALQEATELAIFLRQKYNSCIDDDGLHRAQNVSATREIGIDRRGLKNNKDFLLVVTDFEKQVDELEKLILVPSLLIDTKDPEVSKLLSRTSLGLPDNISLLGMFDFLKNTRDQIRLPPAMWRSQDLEHFLLYRQIRDLHSTFVLLVQLAMIVMQTYQTELNRSMGSVGANGGSIENFDAENYNIFSRVSPSIYSRERDYS